MERIFITQEQKDLLLKDLCARLPYGVKVKFIVNEVSAIEEKFIYNIDGEYSYITDGKSYLTLDIIKALFNNHLDDIKPYLFPLSSMTEEQQKEFYDKYCWSDGGDGFEMDSCSHYYALEKLDWLIKNHFDVYGLIPMGLAIDATGLDIYTNSNE